MRANTRTRTARLVPALLAFSAAVCLADVLILKNGRRQKGNVSIGPEGVCLQTAGGRLEYYDLEEVYEILKGPEADAAFDAAPAQPEPKPKREEPKPKTPFFVPETLKIPDTPATPNTPSPPTGGAAAPLLLMLLAGIGGLMGSIGGIMVLINAFQDSAMKGLLCLFIPFYMFYYAIAEYDADSRKWGLILYFCGPLLIVAGWAVTFAMLFK